MPTLSVVLPTYNEWHDVVSVVVRAAQEFAVVDELKSARSRRPLGRTVKMRRGPLDEIAGDWRPAWQVLSDNMPPSEEIDTLIGHPGVILLSPAQLARLADDLGGVDVVWDWLELRASRADRPVAAIVEGRESAGHTLTVVGPGQWSPQRLSTLVAVLLGEIGLPADVMNVEADAAPVDASDDAPGVSLAQTDHELDEVRRRLSVELQAQRPELFDGSGRPRNSALEKAVQEHTGKKRLSRADMLDLLRKKSS